METFPEQVFQNHMIHHPLLQYQMLFPSLLMSLGAPPSGGGSDEEEFMMDAEGKVNSIDYLRFAALANQLAITQINQVLMDIVKEPEGGTAGVDAGGEIKRELEPMRNLLENGFTQIHRQMAENKAYAMGSNNIVKELDQAMKTMQDMVAKGFLNSLSEMVDIQGAVKGHSNQSVSDAKEFKGMLQSIANKVEELQFADQNMTFSPINCVQNVEKESKKDDPADDQGSEDTTTSTDILLQIQNDLQNLTKALEDFIATSMETAAEREAMRALLENCTKSSPEAPVIDMSNITLKIEEGLAGNLKEIEPHVQNLTKDLGKFDGSLLQAREDLREMQEAVAANMSKTEADLQNLRKLTEKGFADLHTKLDSLCNMSVAPANTQASDSYDCPDSFFPVGKECFILYTGSPLNYKEAEQGCKDINAHLADPKAVLDFIMVVQTLNFNETIGVWLGAQEEKIDQRTGVESIGFEATIWTWKPSGEEIDHGWNARYPLHGGTTCLFLMEKGFQNGLCDLEKDFVCELDQEGDESATGGMMAFPESN